MLLLLHHHRMCCRQPAGRFELGLGRTPLFAPLQHPRHQVGAGGMPRRLQCIVDCGLAGESDCKCHACGGASLQHSRDACQETDASCPGNVTAGSVSSGSSAHMPPAPPGAPMQANLLYDSSPPPRPAGLRHFPQPPPHMVRLCLPWGIGAPATRSRQKSFHVCKPTWRLQAKWRRCTHYASMLPDRQAPACGRRR